MRFVLPGAMDLEFKQFQLSENIVARYVQWFNRSEYREVLYAGTPRTKADVRAWITACIEDPQREYFHVYLSGRLIGHIGLRGVDRRYSHAQIGSFFPDDKHRYGEVMEKSLKYLIKAAKESGIELLTADFVLEASPHLDRFLATGFTRTPTVPHFMTLKIG